MASKQVVVIDYGVGNIASIANMLEKAGAQVRVATTLEAVEKAPSLLLPGVGAFDTCRSALDRIEGLADLLRQRALEAGVPILGVCVGMQLLASGSEEGLLPGLGLIPGRAKQFRFDNTAAADGLKVPHMGWSTVTRSRTSRLFQSQVHDYSRFYFVHSYHVVCEDQTHVAAVADYGGTFHAAVEKDNLFGVQFHPEKSHQFGLALFRSFLGML